MREGRSFLVETAASDGEDLDGAQFSKFFLTTILL